MGSILEKIRKAKGESEHKEIVVQILSLIHSGDLQPGDLLPGERILANCFGVGRASVRVALKFLEFMGVVEINVGKGAYISTETKNLASIHMIDLLDIFRSNPFKDLLEARRVVETKMAALAAINADQEDLQNMREALTDMETDITLQGTGITGTNRFHLGIYKASKNIILYKIGMMLHGLMHESREITLAIPGRAGQSLKEHRQILRAIEAKDSDSAALLMDQHLLLVARDRAL